MDKLKKKIAIIIPGGIGTGRNNIGVPVMERIVKLLARDFEIVVFSLFNVNNNYKAEGFEVISIRAGNLFTRSLKLFLAFKESHHKRKFDIAHGFWALPSGLLAVLIGKFFKIKSIVSILGGDAVALPEINYGQLRKKFSRKLVFLTLCHADEVISLTQYLVDNLAKAGFQKRNIHVIPWGIDTSLFRYKTKAIERPIQFLHIANLNQVKDQMTLLRAFKIVSSEMECHLTMVGEGPLEKRVKDLVADFRLNDKITFKGLMPYENLPEVYQQAHILLHTSLSEGQSEVVTEAMSTGVVVCGTRVGLLYDLPQACVSVDVKDHQALATEVLLLMKDKSRIENLRQIAHSWTSEHSISWTVNKIGKLYR